MVQTEKDRLVFELAWHYLLGLGVEGITPELLDKYGRLSENGVNRTTLNDVFQGLIESLQNKGMSSKVIGQAINGIDRLSKPLFDFSPTKTNEIYAQDWEYLLTTIKFQLKPKGKIRMTPKSAWPQFCRGILSGAEFFSQFSSVHDFNTWVEVFDHDERTRAALPLLLSTEIHGLGFALACDFLKEQGYTNYAKPDVHLRDIFVGLELCPSNVSDYHLFKAICRVAGSVKGEVSPYYVDKIFWLIGSGNFYLDEGIGNNGKIGSRKADFIKFAKAKMEGL